MKIIIFDASTLISLSMNGLLNVLEKLKKNFNGHFIIPKDVKYEVIDRPINIKRFELEALRIKRLLEKGVLEMPSVMGIKSSEVLAKKEKLVNLANTMFVGARKDITIIHKGEASCLALSKILSEKKIEHVIAIDERTTRMLSEKPENLRSLLVKKMHTNIQLKKQEFKHFKDFRFIRSTELVYVAWKKGMLELKDGEKILDAMLYALKFKGAAITSDEIREIKTLK